MAIALLASLIALGLLHAFPRLAQWHLDGLFGRWVRQLDDTAGRARVWLVLALPVLLCLAAGFLLRQSPLAPLLLLLFAVAVLLFAFGPRSFEGDIEAVLDAPAGSAREAAAQRFADSGDTLPWQAHALGRAVALAALHRRFGVLFWFFLLGPAGALLYRLALALADDPRRQLDPAARAHAGRLANALDWLPAQLLVFTLALVGHWDAVIAAWQRWRRMAAPTSWYAEGPGFLGDAACADIDVEIEAGDGFVAERNDPVIELTRMRSAFLRALLAWLSVVALVVLGGWMA